MDRSPGFGSRACHLDCAYNARFRFASGTKSSLGLSTAYSELGGSFCKKHAITHMLAHEALTLCKYRVSGLFHSPYRGSFHLSLTVLVHYRSMVVFSLSSSLAGVLVVLLASDGIAHVPPYLGF